MSWLKLAPVNACLALAASLVTMVPTSASAQEKPGVEALETFRSGRSSSKAIENRFFLKEKRFETAFHIGYVPNNSFAARYVGGLILNYHLNERIAVGANVTYSPDLGVTDLKPLVGRVLLLVRDNPDSQLSLRVDKVTLAATFGVTWAPVYGKINLIGEKVLNFDLYGFAGVGMVSNNQFSATDNNTPREQIGQANDVVAWAALRNQVNPAITLAVGQNYFINQTIALKLDARSAFYIADAPPDGNGGVSKRLYNNFVTSVGVTAFFPKMKPRLYDF